jgi:hypothetical protein
MFHDCRAYGLGLHCAARTTSNYLPFFFLRWFHLLLSAFFFLPRTDEMKCTVFLKRRGCVKWCARAKTCTFHPNPPTVQANLVSVPTTPFHTLFRAALTKRGRTYTPVRNFLGDWTNLASFALRTQPGLICLCKKVSRGRKRKKENELVKKQYNNRWAPQDVGAVSCSSEMSKE